MAKADAMELDLYLEIFNSRVTERRIGEPEPLDDVSPLSVRETAFCQVFLNTLEDIGQLPGLEATYFEKKLGRANGKLNAYGFFEADAHVDLVVAICGDDENEGNRSVPAAEVETAVKKALHVFRAAKDAVYESMEPSSPASDMMEFLHRVRADVRTIRVVVLIDGLVRRAPELEPAGDLPTVQVDVWDLERLFRADSSGRSYESVTTDLLAYLDQPLSCLPAEPTAEDHRCYLAILPGELIHDLYQEHGARLLELNVRSFLQARGKVNRGIRDTLTKDPGHFLAYNNGISATVEDLEIVKIPDGSLGITTMRGLQIVNGGQTVASIHRAKSRDNADLSQVFVQAKITQVVSGHLETLVPFISRFANTQNKVNETDFSANHPFHVRIQQLSSQVWNPGQTSQWFYERARGQWEVARAREGTTPARTRAFDQKYPRQQKIDKTLLARAVHAWHERPEVVSLGGQKNFVRFMEGLTEAGENWEPDEHYFRDLVAKVIILRRAEKVARQIGFSAYRANAVCYTVSLLAYRTAGRVDLNAIWENQDVSEALEETMTHWMPEIHGEIVESAGDRNVTEWCKKKECWTHVQSLSLDFQPGFQEELAEGLPLPTVGKFRESKDKAPRQLTAQERDRQAKTMRVGAEEWLKIIAWGKESQELDGFKLNVAGTILQYAARGWHKVPSPKQTRHTVEMIDLWEASRGAEEPD